MSIENILWGLVGYIAFLIFQLAKPTRNRSGWDFVLQISLFSTACYAVTKILLYFIVTISPIWMSTRIQWTWYNVFPPSTLEVAIGLALAPVIGFISAKLWKKSISILSKVSVLIAGKQRNFEYSDIFFSTCHSLLKKLILVTLKNGKVYVGVLIAATEDPNETMRFIKITPVLSGYRDEETFKVIFTTNYVFDVVGEKEDVQPPSRDVLMPVVEISTLAEFDEQLHKEFIKRGNTKDMTQVQPTI